MTENSCESATEVRNCEKHGDFASRSWCPPTRNPKTYWTGCPECAREDRERQEAESAQKEAEGRQRRLEARIKSAGIPVRFAEKSFDDFVARSGGQIKALTVSMEFVSDFKRHYEVGTFVIFSGPPGTGKTHLAIAIANEVLKSGTVMYASAIDAIRNIRSTWRRNSDLSEREVIDTLAGVDLLIMDEIGVQYSTESEQVHLFDIIDKRYRDALPTILLTNLNTSGLKEVLGDRSYDRLREGGIWVKFDWESHRGNRAA